MKHDFSFWQKLNIDGSMVFYLRRHDDRILGVLRQNSAGGWELFDWRNGSLNERRIDTYLQLDIAQREGKLTLGEQS